MIVIDDSIHCEHGGRFNTFEDAVAELWHRAAIPWDQEPNRAPCTSWRKCGREYHVLEYDDSRTPWTLVRGVPVLNLSAIGVEWIEGFERAWETAGGV